MVRPVQYCSWRRSVVAARGRRFAIVPCIELEDPFWNNNSIHATNHNGDVGLELDLVRVGTNELLPSTNIPIPFHKLLPKHEEE